MAVEQETWLLCQQELISLIERIDSSYDEEALERLRLILYGRGGYDQGAIDQARKKMQPKLLFKLESLERSAYCGTRDIRR